LTPRALAVAFLLLANGGGCTEREADPPPSVRAISDPCENPISARSIQVEQGHKLAGLRLWRVCPCHRPKCFVVGSDGEGKLVSSDEIIVRLLESERPGDAMSAAKLAIHVLEEQSPNAAEAWVPFVPKEPSSRARAPSWDGAKLTFLSANREPVDSTPRCMRYEVSIPQRKADLTNVSDAMGNDCASVR
jgi:hypothetical protein